MAAYVDVHTLIDSAAGNHQELLCVTVFFLALLTSDPFIYLFIIFYLFIVYSILSVCTLANILLPASSLQGSAPAGPSTRTSQYTLPSSHLRSVPCCFTSEEHRVHGRGSQWPRCWSCFHTGNWGAVWLKDGRLARKEQSPHSSAFLVRMQAGIVFKSRFANIYKKFNILC